MTYDEIVQGLECCSRDSKCEECPYSAVSADCFNLEKDAVDLIKKQKAEIEDLKEKNRGLALSLLYEVVNEDEELRGEIAKAAEVKAVKEFAERVKSQDGNYFLESWYESGNECYEFNQEKFEVFIDNLVKEMTKY